MKLSTLSDVATVAMAASAMLMGAAIYYPALSQPPAAPAELTIGECQTVLAGLNALDGHNELTKDQGVVTIPYKFGSGRLRMAIQQNLAALNAVQKDFSEVQQSIYREAAGEAASILPGSVELGRYNRLMGEALKAPCRAKLEPLKVSDLKLDVNEVPGSVLAALDRILEK